MTLHVIYSKMWILTHCSCWPWVFSRHRTFYFLDYFFCGLVWFWELRNAEGIKQDRTLNSVPPANSPLDIQHKLVRRVNDISTCRKWGTETTPRRKYFLFLWTIFTSQTVIPLSKLKIGKRKCTFQAHLGSVGILNIFNVLIFLPFGWWHYVWQIAVANPSKISSIDQTSGCIIKYPQNLHFTKIDAMII